mmetsp:Transcript_103231/g.291498  ORF Transcript_103231/g.291498 Transcript_103231/m.291498 type:complete len:456 (-) Transcript_103231:88-1455(-)
MAVQAPSADAWDNYDGRGQAISVAQFGALHEVFGKHGRQEGTSIVLTFAAFRALACDLQLPVATQSHDEQMRLFAQVAANAGGDQVDQASVSFQEFCTWVAASDDTNAIALREYWQSEDASLWGGAVRALTNLARPLATLAAPALLALKLKAKYVVLKLSQKVAVALKASMQNPTRLFRRRALSPTEAFQGHPAGLLHALRAEVAASGFRGVTRKAIGPYVANSIVAVSMFQTYTAARLLLHGAFSVGQEPGTAAPMLCEASAGATAGLVQATLNTPLYNLRLRTMRGKPSVQHGLTAGLRSLWSSKGTLGVFQNYRYVVAQECCSLAAFFLSYEWFKAHTARLVRAHLDPSGQRDVYAWAAAASASGVVLVAVGTPFENLLEWHIARRTGTTPVSVLGHFIRDARPQCRPRILLSGLRRKLPLAPLAGLPLIAYEVMMHHGVAPVLHDTESDVF